MGFALNPENAWEILRYDNVVRYVFFRPIWPIAGLIWALLSPLPAHAETLEELRERLRPTLESGQRIGFSTPTGVRLNYTLFAADRAPESARPIVISVGKGESAYRYIEFVKGLIERGYGPIYVLDHRSQGHSQRMGAQPHFVHVDKFSEYVDDFLHFTENIVTADLKQRGIQRAPSAIAHSMGGAILNLALLKRPQLFERVAYIAPMFDIDFHSAWLNAFNDGPASLMAQLMCLVNCGNRIGIGRKPGEKVKREHINGIRREYGDELERLRGVEATAVTPSWIYTSIGATNELHERAREQTTESLIFRARHDIVVGNQRLQEYACNAQNCTLVELQGGHALHQESALRQGVLLEKIDEFFETGHVDRPLEPKCKKLFKQIVLEKQ